MSGILFVILFIVGMLIALVGSILGIVDSFQESTTWGLLYLLVPFASLVYTIKFWKQREGIRRSFFLILGGSVVTVVGAVIAAIMAPPLDYAEYGEYSDLDFPEELTASTADGGTSAAYTTAATTATHNDPFHDAINLATDAANRTQDASSKEEWSAIALTWQDSIALLGAVPSSDPNYTTAQTKIATYNQNLSYAQQNAK